MVTAHVSRISTTPAEPLRVFFNAIRRTLEWDPATADGPGSPQDVDESVMEAIVGDDALAAHFRCEPIAAPRAAADASPAPARSSRKR